MSFLVAAFAYLIFEGSATPSHSAAPSLWPQPVNVANNGDPVKLDATDFMFAIQPAAASKPALVEAAKRYAVRIMAAAPKGVPGGLTKASINVINADVPLDFAIDESYTLSITSAEVVVNASTVWGAIRALETFSQLTYGSDDGSELFLEAVNISDAPRFPHRGLLVDTARWYFTIEDLEKIIETMSWSKLNVLHWHITDSQSFPLQSERFPLLSQKGAFPSGRGGCKAEDRCIYSKSDITHLIKYAESRGVRIMPEIDTPGHSKSWGMAYPNVTVVDSCPGLVKNADGIPLNPIEPFALELVDGVLNEFLGPGGSFTDSFVHLGGDEVVFSCWSKSKDIKAYMDAHDLTPQQLQQQWISKIQQSASSVNRTPVNWGDVLIVDGAATPGAKLLPNSVVMAWRQQYELNVVAKAGYSTILSAGWYISSDSNKKWQDLYQIEPLAPASNWSDSSVAAKVIGGEVSKWDCSGFCPFPTTPGAKWEKQVWPAAAVVAERLWSPSGVNDPKTAEPRLQQHRERLIKRGINAGSVPSTMVPFVV